MAADMNKGPLVFRGGAGRLPSAESLVWDEMELRGKPPTAKHPVMLLHAKTIKLIRVAKSGCIKSPSSTIYELL